jgi:peptidoglycan/LPS O-acetylase OafA/YrhL
MATTYHPARPGITTNTTADPAATTSLRDLAAQTKADRNRAVDAYRAIAMLAVALGHWLVIAVATDADGDITARNALEVAPGLGWLTWVFQVMPLFFVVGGFSSAMSLNAHWRRGGRDHDWVVQRLRRMVAPTAVLAGFWVAAMAVAAAAGQGAIAAAGATGAAIPLWFLANYTIDTALAPTVLRHLQRRRTATLATLLGVFATVEVLHIAGVPFVEHLNWVIGWMLFQVAGFLWQAGALPTGRRMAAIAAGLWASAVALVAFGPWPIFMIHVPGTEFSPTHPPSLALVVFGAAYSATAIAAAPAVTRFLERRQGAWNAVVAANGVSMSVYLWHFTAAVVASAVLFALDLLPTAAIGSAAWWVQKLPVIALSAIVLAPIVALVSKVERRSLLAERTDTTYSATTVLVIAGLISAALKAWTMGELAGVIVGAAVIAVAPKVLARH